MRAMVAHPAFDAAANQKFRRPLDYIDVRPARAAGVSDRADEPEPDQRDRSSTVEPLGQPPFDWPAPNGYPDVEGAWLNTGALLGRWNWTGDVVGRAFTPITLRHHGAAGDALTGRPRHDLRPRGPVPDARVRHRRRRLGLRSTAARLDRRTVPDRRADRRRPARRSSSPCSAPPTPSTDERVAPMTAGALPTLVPQGPAAAPRRGGGRGRGRERNGRRST